MEGNEETLEGFLNKGMMETSTVGLSGPYSTFRASLISSRLDWSLSFFFPGSLATAKSATLHRRSLTLPRHASTFL